MTDFALNARIAPAAGTQGESVWFAARGEHSEKPEHAHLWIEKHWPNLPKIELNARTARDGWDRWGNEAPPAKDEDENQDRFEEEFNQDKIPAGSHISDSGLSEMPDAAPSALGSTQDKSDEGLGETTGKSDPDSNPAAVASAAEPIPMEIPAFLIRKPEEKS